MYVFIFSYNRIQKLKQLLLKKLQYLKNKNNKKYTYKKMLLRRKCHVY